MSTTFLDLYSEVRTACGLKSADDSLIKTFINDRYKTVAIWPHNYAWPWLCEKTTLLTVAKYTTGTVTATEGSATITGSGTTFTSAMVGRKFKVDGFEEIYTISAYVSATEITLDNVFNGTTSTTYTFVIYQDLITLPSGLDTIISLRQHRTPKKFDCVSLRKLLDYDPSPTISDSDPTVYAHYIPDANENQIIMVSPPPYRQIVLELEYKKVITELSNNTDEPLIPEQYRHILKYGAMADVYTDIRNDKKRADVREEMYNKILMAMHSKYKSVDDRKRIAPVTKRQSATDLQSLINRGYDLKEIFDIL